MYALQQLGFGPGRLFVVNRTVAKAESLAKEFDCGALPDLSAASLAGAGLTASSVRLLLSTLPGSAGWEAPVEVLKGLPVVFDVSYLPQEGTKLCKQAIAHQCMLVRGIDMLVAQGLRQSELWTGRWAQHTHVRAVVEEAYKSNTASRDE